MTLTYYIKGGSIYYHHKERPNVNSFKLQRERH